MNLQKNRGRWHTARGEEVEEPFLMTIVGASDHWLFVSSTGALTAGRTNAEQAIFSYETEDRLHRAAGQVGPVTAIRIHYAGGTSLWRPFEPRSGDGVTRTLAKRTLGDGLRFSETHHASGLTFAYEWMLSDRYGFLRRCSLQLEAGRSPTHLELVDGLRAVQPFGVDSRTQQSASVLVDAYKHAELLDDGHVGLYALTARIVDRPEPSEALRCTVAFLRGLPGATAFLDDEKFIEFVHNGQHPEAGDVRLGRPSSYLVHAPLDLEPGETTNWIIGTDIGWDAARVVDLREKLTAPDFERTVQESVDQNRSELVAFVARADGLQTTSHPIHDDRHATNAMFNCMRGGVIPTDAIHADDVREFLATRNEAIYAEHADLFERLGTSFSHDELLETARASEDVDLLRLCSEYMPLTFSRRHGDPSRPWNTFNIRVKAPDGSRRFYFEGNWRDVFQNWEALLSSFPSFIESAWTTFFNASTADGYNPYRITRDGMDWERPDPEDPWAHIGYWGDHQIIYSLKLLELSEAHRPGLLAARLDEPRYVFADVPYRIAPYEEIVADPHETIAFDREHDRRIDARREAIGADGNLVHDGDAIVHATLGEKLLVSLLAKVANFVAEGGIWMNTQRPEWNDANNALVGNGLSVVTLAYLVRHVRFLRQIFAQHDGTLTLHDTVATWLEETIQSLEEHPGDESALARRRLLDRLGEAASQYRRQIYEHGLGTHTTVVRERVDALLAICEERLGQSLRACQRPDGLFHAYNLLDLRGGTAEVSYLETMLEGQVAALSSGMLAPQESIDLVDELFDSPLYREDQNTFLLYPMRTLPRFLDRGVIPSESVRASPLLSALADDATTSVVVRDADDISRFDGSFRNVRDLRAALDALAIEQPDRYGSLVPEQCDAALDVWEEIFVHRAYTGRSGSMYGYEGLGSVYWHMVSKLNLAMLECTIQAADAGADRETVGTMADHYYALRAGLGDHKSFAEYGAFPTDAYSHTPPNGGARQPGMTGQVKEDLLTRRGELGVRVHDGRLHFEPLMLRSEEFVTEATTWHGLSPSGEPRSIALGPGQLAFTVCQVPVVYTEIDGDDVTVKVRLSGGVTREFSGALDDELSREVFERTGRVRQIDVGVGRGALHS